MKQFEFSEFDRIKLQAFYNETVLEFLKDDISLTDRQRQHPQLIAGHRWRLCFRCEVGKKVTRGEHALYCDVPRKGLLLVWRLEFTEKAKVSISEALTKQLHFGVTQVKLESLFLPGRSKKWTYDLGSHGYRNEIEGDFSNFHGKETVRNEYREIVYSCRYSGGFKI